MTRRQFAVGLGIAALAALPFACGKTKGNDKTGADNPEPAPKMEDKGGGGSSQQSQ